MSDESLNGAIDEVARQMTAGAAAGAAGFRRRVLARIAANEAPRRTWRPVFVLTPLAAAIAIAVAVFISRDTVRVPPAATDAPTIAVAPPPAATTAIPVKEEPASPIIAAEARRAEARGIVARAEADSPLDPITVAPLTVDALTHDPNPIERLETPAPMTVAPLDITDPQKERER